MSQSNESVVNTNEPVRYTDKIIKKTTDTTYIVIFIARQ